MKAGSIVAATTITKVWLALGGDPPKRGRARAFYRNGNNPQAVSLSDSKGAWFDHRDNTGGGVLDLIERALGCDRVGALQWLSDFTGLPLKDRPATRAERRVLAQRREREQRDMRAADFFRIAATSMAEQILYDLPEAVSERYAPTPLLLDLRAADTAALLAIYRDFRAREPRLTAALVYAGERARRRLCIRLARFIAAGMEVSSVA
jgi:hypothetical protein